MTMTIEMPESLARRVWAKCAREGRGVGDVAVAMFAAWLDGGTRTRSVKALKGVLPPPAKPPYRSKKWTKSSPKPPEPAEVPGLDTNVIVRYLAQDDPQQSPIATRVFEERLLLEGPGFVSSVVFCEVAWGLSRAYKVPRKPLTARCFRPALLAGGRARRS